MKETIKNFLRPHSYWTVEDVFYSLFWCVMAILVSGGLFFYAFPKVWEAVAQPCPIRVFTGLYCPGCGGTRAFLYAIQGDVKNSLLHHPAVLYLIIVCGIFQISQTVSRISRGRIGGMKYRHIYTFLLIFLFVANFLWKNISLLVFHISLIR